MFEMIVGRPTIYNLHTMHLGMSNQTKTRDPAGRIHKDDPQEMGEEKGIVGS